MLKKLNKKGIALLIASAVLLTAIIGTTIAYLIDVTETVEDTFIPANVVCSVSESGGLYTVTNEGNIPVYIRVAVIVNATDGANLTWNSTSMPSVDLGSGWTEHDDGYYYYNGTIASNGSVKFNGVSGNVVNYEIKVLAEAIQATPDEAVQNAWKMTYDGTSWSVYTKN